LQIVAYFAAAQVLGGLTLDVARQTGTAAVVQLGKQGLRVSRDQLVQP
jgi:hypothetical protein